MALQLFSDGMLVDFGSSGSSDSSDSSNIFDSSGSCGSDSIGSSSSNAFSSVDSIKFFDDSGGSTAPTPLEPPSSKRAQCAETLSLQSSDDDDSDDAEGEWAEGEWSRTIWQHVRIRPRCMPWRCALTDRINLVRFSPLRRC